MTFSKPGSSNSNNPQAFGNESIHHFEVYTERNERIGEVVDFLRDETHNSKFLIINLDSLAGKKQIVLPLNYVLIDQRLRRVLLVNLTKAQIAELPAYSAGSTHPQSSYEIEEPIERQVRNTALHETPLEASAPLEGSHPLDYEVVPSTERSNHVPAAIPIPEQPLISTHESIPAQPYTSPQELTSSRLEEPRRPLDDSIHAPKVVAEEKVQLLEERLVVDRKRRKVGEVIVRKEIETRIVEVPVRHEKLIVEQISPEHKQLASFALGQPEMEGVELRGGTHPEHQQTVSGEFTSARAASQFLEAIANRPEADYRRIQVKIVLENAELQETYQQWLNNYSAQDRV